ncbi:PIN domain nuclease [Actinoplanes solisilvae]|uniref:PIN domain nuclease n=1 Tax=Actinoplanes solisilvae TaxID=2486853 RepID=UPI000FDB7EDA|nr:PIN domain nuclease [Actinoplanes solisilvae]
MSHVRFLADTSAVIRILRSPEVLRQCQEIIGDGTVAVCPITELEHLFSARSKADREHQISLLRTTFSWVVMPERVFEDAAVVQHTLTDLGPQRSAGPVDLLTAAAAKQHGLELLHYDADFESVAAATGQPTRWLAKPGTID